MRFETFLESKPTEVETFQKIQDWDIKALKGYSRKIGLSQEIIRGAGEPDVLIDEIMGYLYDDDWLVKLMKAGVV